MTYAIDFDSIKNAYGSWGSDLLADHTFFTPFSLSFAKNKMNWYDIFSSFIRYLKWTITFCQILLMRLHVEIHIFVEGVIWLLLQKYMSSIKNWWSGQWLKLLERNAITLKNVMVAPLLFTPNLTGHGGASGFDTLTQSCKSSTRDINDSFCGVTKNVAKLAV